MDLQVMIPRTMDAARVASATDQQSVTYQQQLAVQLKQTTAEQQQQVLPAKSSQHDGKDSTEDLSKEKQEKVNTGIAYKEIGDLYSKSDNLAGGLDMYNKSLASSPDRELKLWSQFLVGETYIKMNKDDQAQNIFAQMKVASGPEGFWTKVVDFYLADSKWWEKYGSTVKK